MSMHTKWLVLVALAVVGCADAAPPPEVDLGPRRQLVYVTAARPQPKHGEAHSKNVDTVHVFDRETLERVGAFTLAGGVGEVGATGDGAIVYVVNPDDDAVTLFDTRTYALERLVVGVSPEHSYLTPDHRQLWVGNDTSANVTIIDLVTGELLGSVLTGFGHHKVAFAEDDDGRVTFGYVSNINDSSITPVSAERMALTNVAGVGASPHGIDYSRSTARVLNCSGDPQSNVEVIATRDDATTPDVDEQHTIIARVALPSRCRSLHTDDEGTYAYASLTDIDAFVRIDAATLAVEVYETGVAPDGFVVIGARAYVGNAGEGTVSVIDLSGGAATRVIGVGRARDPGDPDAAGGRLLRRDGAHLFVTNAFDGTVSVIDAETDVVVGTLEGLPDVVGVAVAGPTGGTAFPR